MSKCALQERLQLHTTCLQYTCSVNLFGVYLIVTLATCAYNCLNPLKLACGDWSHQGHCVYLSSLRKQIHISMALNAFG